MENNDTIFWAVFSTCLGTLDRQEYFTVKKTKKQ